MPHVIVKLWPGQSQHQKVCLAEAIVRDVMDILGHDEESVSVAMEEVHPDDWSTQVYEPDVRAKWDRLYKKPGYGPHERG